MSWELHRTALVQQLLASWASLASVRLRLSTDRYGRANGGVVGNVVGAIPGGYLTDRWAERQARRHNGIFEPESRLTLLVFPTVITFAGLLMIGFACEQKLHWAVIYVGFGFISVGLTGTANIGMTYVMDSCFAIAPECLLLVNGLKNVVAFGFAYGAIPWSESQGYAKVYCFQRIRLQADLTLILVLRRPSWNFPSSFSTGNPTANLGRKDQTSHRGQMGFD